MRVLHSSPLKEFRPRNLKSMFGLS